MVDGRVVVMAATGLALASFARAEGPWVSLFTGQDLAGWSVKCTPEDRDKTYWTVSNGSICVDSMGDKDHDYVWLQSDGEYGDFDLRLKFQVYKGVPGNSGVQIRSRYDEAAGWLNGPQLDIHPPNPLRVGLIYDETRGVNRWIYPSLERGNHTIKPSMANPKVQIRYGEDEWNEMTISARGTHLRTVVNGEVASDFDGRGILDDDAHRKHNVGMKGHIALQLHKSNELRARFKDIEIREP